MWRAARAVHNLLTTFRARASRQRVERAVRLVRASGKVMTGVAREERREEASRARVPAGHALAFRGFPSETELVLRPESGPRGPAGPIGQRGPGGPGEARTALVCGRPHGEPIRLWGHMSCDGGPPCSGRVAALREGTGAGRAPRRNPKEGDERSGGGRLLPRRALSVVLHSLGEAAGGRRARPGSHVTPGLPPLGGPC